MAAAVSGHWPTPSTRRSRRSSRTVVNRRFALAAAACRWPMRTSPSPGSSSTTIRRSASRKASVCSWNGSGSRSKRTEAGSAGLWPACSGRRARNRPRWPLAFWISEKPGLSTRRCQAAPVEQPSTLRHRPAKSFPARRRKEQTGGLRHRADSRTLAAKLCFRPQRAPRNLCLRAA